MNGLTGSTKDRSNWLDRVSLARLPWEAAPRLASSRDHRNLEIARAKADPGVAWIRWSAPDREIASVIHQIQGSLLYEQRQGAWYRPVSALPDFDVPLNLNFHSIGQVLLPARITPIEPPDQDESTEDLRSSSTLKVTLAVSASWEPTSALRSGLDAVIEWAESVPSGLLRGLQAAWSGDEVLIRGERLPLIPGARRYWGQRVLIPLGLRLDPELSDRVVAQVLGIGPDTLVLWEQAAPELIPDQAFGRLSLAAIRSARGSRSDSSMNAGRGRPGSHRP